MNTCFIPQPGFRTFDILHSNKSRSYPNHAELLLLLQSRLSYKIVMYLFQQVVPAIQRCVYKRAFSNDLAL